MYKSIPFTLLLLFSASLLNAQDSLVNFNDLSFTSLVEKQILTDYFLSGKIQPFQLFMANSLTPKENELEQNQNEFYSYVNTLNAQYVTIKKNEKKIKFLYDNIHKTFLKKYEEKNRFQEIFSLGYYNCVSATALYALAFEKLGIPYVIKELPSHVYLVTYPLGEQIRIETTAPMGGFQTFNDAFKETFVKTLKDQKMISADEYNSQGTNELFDKFYFGNEQDISLTNLVGIQYMNDALYKLDEGKYEDAFKQIEKGYLFFPNARSSYLLMTMCSAAFEAHKQKDTVQAKYLSKLSRYKELGVKPEMIAGEFANVIQVLLFNEGKKEELKNYYNMLDKSIDDPAVKDEIDYLYYYESARLLYNQARFKEALPIFEEAMTIKPLNQDVNSAFISTLSQSVGSQSDNLARIQMLEKYSKKYPTLQDHNVFNSMLASCYLIQFGMEYTLEKPAQGDKFKTLFEDQYRNRSGLTIHSELIGHAYSVAAVYYYRQGQTTRAKNLIETGLQYSPNNQELIVRKQMIR